MNHHSEDRREQAYQAVNRLLVEGRTLFESLVSPSLAALIGKVSSAKRGELEILVIFAVVQQVREGLAEGVSEEQAQGAFSAWIVREGGEAMLAELETDPEAPARGKQRRGGKKAKKGRRR